jgi:beta-galactosidase/beta-glucuronidase
MDPSDGGRLSEPGSSLRDGYAVQVPTTVLNALTKAGVYPDLRVGLNAYQIPDSSEEFNARHDLSRFSHLPDKQNPWRAPWWFRREFTLPKLPGDRRTWLHFDAINYRAEVWLNGRRIAETNTMAGMFQRFQFDITEQSRAGTNALAVKVCPVDHPGVPAKQVEVLGPDRGYQSELMHDVTEIMTIGYDCMMTVPDRNMGIWQKVWIDTTGPVDLRNPFVVTDLALPEANRATLAVSAELVNATGAAVISRAVSHNGRSTPANRAFSGKPSTGISGRW